MFLAGTLFAVSNGMTVGWTAPMIPYLISNQSHIETTRHEAEQLESALLIGAFCGLPTTIFFTQKIGRKLSLLLASCVVLVAWTAIAFGDNLIYIYVARFFSGMAGNMAFVAAPMYLAEIADQKIRGFLSSIIYLMMLTGCLIMYCVGPYLPYYSSCLIGICLAVSEISIFSFMPETPYYLMFKNRPEEAKKSLQFFRPKVNVEKEMQDISAAITRQKTERGRLKDLFVVGSNRKALVIMTALNAGQNFSAINVVMMNLHLILREAGSIYMEDSLAGILFGAILLTAACTASLQLDRHGRKVLLITSSVLTGCCLFVLAVYFNLKNSGYDVLQVSWIPIAAVMTYAASFKLGLGIVPIVVTAEIFPARIKAMGMTIADAVYVTWGIASLYVYQWLGESYGLHVPFYLFSVCAFLLALFTSFYIPETKGKSLEEIQMVLKGGRIAESRAKDNTTEVPLMVLKV
ncbi:hypothetical protein NQ318_011356 [Aromia moschata]|uniref:Major facilitator superfamily (MFS) profile domain-containing protein n=1 Tax=Aromia moschata TaxID=1265417 RepID=A0AAV8YSL7_9CUCU|nr:hypothetical protein NQ318_011356 [Aromia moschata]